MYPLTGAISLDYDTTILANPVEFKNRLDIKQHLQTKQHASKLEIKKTSGLLEKFLDSSASTSSRCSDTENVVASELALTYHTVKHNLSYNSMDCTIKLNKIIYCNSATATAIHLARTKMEALVTEVLGPYSVQNVVDAVNTDNLFYCLQTDASNKKNIKLFPLVIQYFTAKNGIEQKLLDFYENSNESADGMFEAIQNSLEKYKLSFHNVSGLSADNTNANFGVNHSLFTNMQNVVPHLIKGNCHAHIVHNCVRHAMNFLSYDIENVILKIYAHFSHSAVRREELKKFVASVDGDFHEIKRHVGTRWLSLLPCIDTLLLNWSPIRSYFLSLDHCPIILQNLLMLNETENDIIEIYLHFCSHLLNLFNKSIKCLEGNCITILDIYGIMLSSKQTSNLQDPTSSMISPTTSRHVLRETQNMTILNFPDENFNKDATVVKPHAAADCPRPHSEHATCVNCGGAHPANHSSCPAHKKEARNKKASTVAKTGPVSGPITRAAIVPNEVSETAPSSLMAPANGPKTRLPPAATDNKTTRRRKIKRGKGTTHSEHAPKMAAMDTNPAPITEQAPGSNTEPAWVQQFAKMMATQLQLCFAQMTAQNSGH
ncbi:hypothetical protein evm_014426 [Chilo suppressalis]|nr:hypothetical protein evm_014426 [Chilo suppressalis]